MISVTFLKVCFQSVESFSCRRCGYIGLVDYICLEAFSFEWTIWFLLQLQVSGCCVGELKFERTYFLFDEMADLVLGTHE